MSDRTGAVTGAELQTIAKIRAAPMLRHQAVQLLVIRKDAPPSCTSERRTFVQNNRPATGFQLQRNDIFGNLTTGYCAHFLITSFFYLGEYESFNGIFYSCRTTVLNIYMTSINDK